MNRTMNVTEFSQRVGVSVSTIRRRVQDRRQGIDNDFPLPLFPEGKKLIWDRQAVLDWLENPSSQLTPSKVLSLSPKKQERSLKKIREELNEIGVPPNREDRS